MWFRFVSLLYLVVFVVVLAWMVTTWSDLPKSLPMHFGENLKPDRMASGTQVFWMYVLLTVFQAMFFVLLVFVIRWLPVSLVNIPNREYWLTGERREETLRWMSTMLLSLGVATQLFMASLYYLTLQVGRGAKPDIYPEFLWTMGLFLAVVLTAVFLSFRRFARS